MNIPDADIIPSRGSGQKKPSLLKLDPQKPYFCLPKGELSLGHCLVNHIGFEIVLTDPHGKIVFANSAALRALKSSSKQIKDKNFTDFFADRAAARVWRKTAFQELKKKRVAVSSIVEREVHGQLRVIDLCSTYLWRESGEYILNVGRDITDNRVFETKFKQSEDRYRLLSEQASEGILIMDLEGTILYANRAAAQIFSADLAKIEGQHFEKFLDSKTMANAWQCLRTVSKGRPSICPDINIKSAKGEIIPAEFSATPVREAERVTQVHVIFRDMRASREVEDLKHESEKMKALHHFISGTTSEIQLPLQGLVDSSQRLLDKYQGRDFEYIGYKEFTDIMATLKTMNERMRYCSQTTDRLMSLSRRKANIEESRSCVNTVVKESVDILRHSAEVSDIKIKVKLSSRLPQVAIGPVELGQVFNHIFTNAIQSVSAGGNVHVTTTFQKAKNMVRLDCQDDGVGIPKEILPRIFEPFFTTKHRGVGKNSGLGLSVVYSIIKAYHGDISIKSKFRLGTLVTVFLPVSHARGKIDGGQQ